MAAVMSHYDDFESAARPTGRMGKPEPYALVVGLGISGLAAARHLVARGDNVVVIDSRAEPPALRALSESCPTVPVALETLDERWIEGADCLVLSPGLSTDLPLVAAARRRGVPVIGELELFAQAAPAPLLAVTGSNGKSTVTSLTAHLLAAQGFNAPAGGNLGPAALELLDGPVPDVYVIEVSSFQLETSPSLRPLAGAVLNVSPDHIDRHGSLERYAAIKTSLLTSAERAIYNWDDPLIRRVAEALPDCVPFSVSEPLERGWSIVERGGRWLARDLSPLIPCAELGLAGEIGEANSLASLALAQCIGGDIELALAALPGFVGLPHRCRHVAARHGVSYVDDSKGTNVGATVAAIKGAGAPVVLIAGGQGKGADFAPLAEIAAGRVRAVVLIGEAAPQLERAFAGVVPTVRAADMADAVTRAAELAIAGDWVLLSPACASQDMFADYRARGDAFTAAVRGLPE